MLDSGVRNSWVTFDTKSFLSRAASRSRVTSWSTVTTPESSSVSATIARTALIVAL